MDGGKEGQRQKGGETLYHSPGRKGACGAKRCSNQALGALIAGYELWLGAGREVPQPTASRFGTLD